MAAAVLKRVTGSTTKRPRVVDQQYRGGARLFQAAATGYTDGHIKELIDKTSSPQSNALPDPFQNLYESSTSGRTPVEPYYPFSRLAQLPLENNVLLQCIDAYVTNVASYGWMLEFIGDPGDGEKGGEGLPRVQAEKSGLESFVQFPSPDGRTFREHRESCEKDQETLGQWFLEVGREKAGDPTSRVTMVNHLPGVTMRMTRRDKDAVEITTKVLDPAGSGKWIMIKAQRRFRRFVQSMRTAQASNSGGVSWIYFKEFGDPRVIDSRTGEVASTALPAQYQATEVLYDALYAPGYEYGVPRWIGQLPAILGSRESEMVNLNFFRENAIPALAVLVSGGALTGESFEKVRDYINAVKGQKAMHRILILEAVADEGAGSIEHSQAAPKIEMKPMISERQQDGLFQEYDQKNMQKIRAAFRLPPIYVGRAEDYTRASAYASMLTAESQIFAPKRTHFDDVFNTKILSTWQPKFYRFKSLGPVLTEPESLSRMLDTFNKAGALTPNVAIKIANQMLGVKVDPITDAWGDLPFPILMAEVTAGATFKGLETFIQAIEPPAPPTLSDGKPVKAKPKPKTPAGKGAEIIDLDQVRKMVQRAVQSELTLVAEDLRESVEEAKTRIREAS